MTKYSDPDISASKLQHVELWKYFESRGAGVKDTMFNVVTWIVGFAAVILGFIVKEFITVEADSLAVSNPYTLLLLAVGGMLFVVYADILIKDFSDHINRNFDRADSARDESNSLLDILDICDEDPKKSTEMPNICKHVRRVVWIFGGFFVIGVILGLNKLLLNWTLCV